MQQLLHDLQAAIPGGIADEAACAARLAHNEPVELGRYLLLPGLVDVHVHLREPGFSYKETIASGTAAAAAAGYTALCAMPNLSPVPDSVANLQLQRDIIARDARVAVYPYGAITCGELGETLSDMAGMAAHVCAFSDDGKGVQRAEMMTAAMERAAALGKLIAAHCEVNDLLQGGYIHAGAYAAQKGHKGISSASEYEQIARDITLCQQTGCSYHVCHISTAQSVALIRAAKARGVDITCETGPHYLLMDDSMLQEEGRFKMNPPLRSPADREALLQGLADGTIDCIATDHAPHSAEEKSRGLKDSLMGVVGLETAFPLLYTYLVKPGHITLEHLVRAMSSNPARRFGLPHGYANGDYTVYDLQQSYTIDPAAFYSMGRSTPFAGWQAQGKCCLTVCGGKEVYRADSFPVFNA